MAVATISLFDTVTDSADAPVPNATVTLTFGYNGATTADGLLQPSVRQVQTDSTGKFTFSKVIPNDLISPSNTVYVIDTPWRTYEVAPQSGNGSSQQSTAANVIVNNPLALAPYSPISGPITIAGNLTVNGVEVVTSSTGFQVNSSGDISGRSLSLSASPPYTSKAAPGSAVLAGPNPWFDVLAQGATGLGVADDTAAIQAAINLATAGGIVWLPAGTYRIATALTLKAGVLLRGAGVDVTTLVFDDVTGSGITTSNVPTASSAVSGSQALGSFTVILAAGQGANFATGSWMSIHDTNGSFITKVLSVSVDTLTLREALPFTFAGTATVDYWTGGGLLSGIGVEDMTLKVATIPSVNRPYLLDIRYSDRPVVRRVRATGGTASCFIFVVCKDGLFADCTSDTIQNGTSGDGFNSTRGVGTALRNCRTTNCAFGVGFSYEAYSGVFDSTFGGKTASGSGRGIEILLCATCTIEGNHVSDFAATGCYLVDSYDCTVTGNTFENIGVSGSAINIGGNTTNMANHNVIVGNLIRNCGAYGISVVPTGGATQEVFNLISGNVIQTTGNVAIYLVASRNLVVGNIMDAWTSAGVWTEVNTTKNSVLSNHFGTGQSGPAIQDNTSAGGNIINGNSLYGSTANFVAGDADQSVLGALNLTGNLAMANATSHVSIGVAIQSNIGLNLLPSATASGATGAGLQLAPALTAAANSDSLAVALISYTTAASFAKGAFTGLTAYGLFIQGSGFSQSGAGTIANAYGLFISAPTIGTANYAAQFNGGVVFNGDAGAGVAGALSLTNAVGIGNGVNTNMQAPLKSTGGGPTSAVLVTDWIKIYDGTTTKWIPAFT